MSQISRLAEIVLFCYSWKEDTTLLHFTWLLRIVAFFSIFNIYLFMAVLGLHCCTWLSLTGKSCSYSALQCGFSLQWLLLLWIMGPRVYRLSRCGHGIGCPPVCGIFLDRGAKLQGGSPTTGSPGKSAFFFPFKLGSMAGKAEGKYKTYTFLSGKL